MMYLPINILKTNLYEYLKLQDLDITIYFAHLSYEGAPFRLCIGFPRSNGIGTNINIVK